MDFPSSLKKSFKKHHSRKISVGNIDEDDTHHEEQPILAEHNSDSTSSSDDRREVILKIDGVDQTPNNSTTSSSPGMHQGNNKVWKDSSYEFWTDGIGNTPQRSNNPFEFQHGKDVAIQDPPSRLIGQFLNKQRAAGGEMSLDVDLEMNELPRGGGGGASNNNLGNNKNDRVSTSKDLKVSFFQEPPTNRVVDIEPDNQHDRPVIKNEISPLSSDDEDGDEIQSRRRPSNADNSGNSNYISNKNASDDQVVKCTSFQRRGSVMLGRLKTKSRLLDAHEKPPLPPDRRMSGRVAKSGVLKSGILGGRASGMLGGKPTEEEEEDPLFDEDLPEDFGKGKLDFLTLLQWISLILIGGALVCTLAISEWKRKTFRGLQLWKWEVLVLVVLCGRLVSGWVIRIVVFFVERNFMLRKKVLYFVYGVRKAVQNCIWLGLVLIAWHFMFDKRVEGHNKFLQLINKLMVCMVIATLLWLVKTLMVKVLASSFHVSTFFDRIQESLFNQYVIETLSGPPLIEIKHNQDEEDRTMAEVWRLQNAGATLPPDLKASAFASPTSGRVIGNPGGAPGLSFKVSGSISRTQEDQGISIDHLHKLNPKNVSAWNMKRLMNIVRFGTISTLDERILPASGEDESSTQIRSEYEAKAAARKIFRNVAQPGSKFIYLEDLMRFLREEEALKAMTLVGVSSESEKISKASLKNWVVNSFFERRALALTLNDTKTAVKKLHQMVNVLIGILIVIICLVILGIATSKVLVFVSSQVVVVAFIFGNTCKTVFEAIIFLFVMHPFDVGDRCEIDGVQMIVEEMNILTTVFLRFDNQKIMFPNSVLSTRPIGNYYRSPDMGDSVDFVVHMATPAEKIALMKQRITSYIEGKKEHWYPSPMVVLMNLEDLNKLKMSVWVRHRMNHQDMGEKWVRRALLIDEMVKCFKELDIEYRLYPLDINIRAMPPTAPPTSTRMPSTWPSATT